MQVTTNQKFVNSRRRIGRLATLGGFVCLVGGLVLTWVTPEFVLVSYLTLLPGYILISYGGYNTIRWGTKPRVDELLSGALKTLDHRHHLFNYVSGLPAENLLLTPESLVVLEIRPYYGEFRNTGMRWKRKLSALGIFMSITEGGLGNPTKDALRKAAEIKAFLVNRLGEEGEQILVEAAVVFTHPRATLVLDNPEIPVSHARELRGLIHSSDRKARISGNVHRRLVKLLKNPEVA